MRDSKRFRSILLFHTVCVIVSVLYVFASTGFAQEVKRDLTKQSDVNEYVDQLTGFGALEGITKSFARVDVNDDNTPFLHRQINGKKGIWRLEINAVYRFLFMS